MKQKICTTLFPPQRRNKVFRNGKQRQNTNIYLITSYYLAYNFSTPIKDSIICERLDEYDLLIYYDLKWRSRAMPCRTTNFILQQQSQMKKKHATRGLLVAAKLNLGSFGCHRLMEINIRINGWMLLHLHIPVDSST